MQEGEGWRPPWESPMLARVLQITMQCNLSASMRAHLSICTHTYIYVFSASMCAHTHIYMCLVLVCAHTHIYVTLVLVYVHTLVLVCVHT